MTIPMTKTVPNAIYAVKLVFKPELNIEPRYQICTSAADAYEFRMLMQGHNDLEAVYFMTGFIEWTGE